MCFSAGASFGASAVLSVIGTTGVIKAKTIPQGLFAGIPFLFSIQQLSEGMLWLSLKNADLASGQSFYTYTFLVFAMMVWPILVPLTIRLLEKDPMRIKRINVLLAIGITVFIGIGWVLLYFPVQVIRMDHHLHYEFDFPSKSKTGIIVFSLLYFLSTILPPFISGIKRMKWLGVVFAVSYLFAITFYSGFVVSVWCYFAAILSLVVIWIMAGMNKPVFTY
ncbi:MAG TPA: DUF6629 family protein [Chitinophagaceae bacterium]